MKLTIVRGLPGSGKTTLAKQIAATTGADHFEADQFFENDDGSYEFLPSLAPAAHSTCRFATEMSLSRGRDVVVSNTFIHLEGVEEYRKMAASLNADFEVIVCRGDFQNIHGVPAEVIERMRANWED